MSAPSYTFEIVVHNEVDELSACLVSLRTHHPAAPVLIISDGDDRGGYRRLARAYNARYVAGESLKPSRGADYCRRLFVEFLRCPTDYLLKVDPDTRFHRPFRFFPNAHFFGTVLEAGTPLEHVQGGCQGFSKEVCVRAVESPLLTDPHFYDDPAAWCHHPFVLELVSAYQKAAGVQNCDFLIYNLMNYHLDAPPASWSEALCLWREVARNPHNHYAVTHPHKLTQARPPAPPWRDSAHGHRTP
jgi:hypothetical protein